MTDQRQCYGLQVSGQIADLVEHEVLPGTGIEPARFWAGLAGIVAEFSPRTRRLLATRDHLQATIDDWHRAHLRNPRDLVPESNMPGYPWLAKTPVDAESLPAKMKALRVVGVPYTDAEIASSTKDVAGKTEEDALVAYLQELGTVIKSRR